MVAVNVNLRITRKTITHTPLRCHEGCPLTKGSIALLKSVYTAKAERARRSPPFPATPNRLILIDLLPPFLPLRMCSYKKRLYSDEGFDSSKSVYTAKLKELTDLGNPVENRLYETNHRNVSMSLFLWLGWGVLRGSPISK